MALTVNDIRTRGDVVRYLTESAPKWDHDVTNSWDAVAILLFSAAVLGTTVPQGAGLCGLEVLSRSYQLLRT